MLEILIFLSPVNCKQTWNHSKCCQDFYWSACYVNLPYFRFQNSGRFWKFPMATLRIPVTFTIHYRRRFSLPPTLHRHWLSTHLAHAPNYPHRCRNYRYCGNICKFVADAAQFYSDISCNPDACDHLSNLKPQSSKPSMSFCKIYLIKILFVVFKKPVALYLSCTVFASE